MKQVTSDEAESGERDWLTPGRARSLMLVALTAIGIYLCYQLVRPFIPALAWALALAVLVWPLHQRVMRSVRWPGLAAGVTVTIVAVALLAPAYLVIRQLLVEATAGLTALDAVIDNGLLRQRLEAWPAIANLVAWIEQNVELETSLRQGAEALVPRVSSLVTGSVWMLVELTVILVALFFLLRDREAAHERLRELSPLTRIETDRIVVRVLDTLRATVYGTIAVSIVQGALGGLIFWLLGLPAPLLWGAIMALMALVPILGAFVVWVPAALWLALDGEWWKAAVLAAWGGLVVSLIDNILYPMLVGNELRLHTAQVLVAVGGGLLLFGAAGVILGPLVLAVTLALLDIWHLRREPSHLDDGDEDYS